MSEVEHNIRIVSKKSRRHHSLLQHHITSEGLVLPYIDANEFRHIISTGMLY